MTINELFEQARQVEAHQVAFHPIIRAYMQRLGLVELINKQVGGKMEVKPGIIVAGMIQDTLSGRSPLYHLKDFFVGQDMELILGEKVDPSVFGDYNVGRVLDLIQKAGASKIFSEVARRAAVIFELDLTSGHWDSTSVNVWGDDYSSSNPEDTIDLTYGYSKDHRPDLKQFMLSMLCVEHNIPIMGESHDGNSSDKALNHKIIPRIMKYLSKNSLAEGAFTYTADSAMVTEENLACFDPIEGAAPFFFVTRLPRTYNETDRVVTEAVQADHWEEIGVLATAKSTAKRPCASYRAHDTEVELYGRHFRAIVIHSSNHDKRQQKGIDREITQAKQKVQDSIAVSLKKSFACRADAEDESERLKSLPMPCHTLTTRIEEEITYAKGRPSKDGQRKVAERRWRIQADIAERTEVIEQKRIEAGCFVLLSNRPKEGPEGQTAEELLRTYKAQDGIERNFSFLKDPLIVNDLFLKTPERIEALGMILLLCLLIWNLMQRQMRQYLKETDSTLEGLGRTKATTKPTSYMMTTKFRYVPILKVGQARKLKQPLTATQKAYLAALGLTEAIFTSIHSPP